MIIQHPAASATACAAKPAKTNFQHERQLAQALQQADDLHDTAEGMAISARKALSRCAAVAFVLSEYLAKAENMQAATAAAVADAIHLMAADAQVVLSDDMSDLRRCVRAPGQPS